MGTLRRIFGHDLSRVSLGIFGAFLPAMNASAAFIRHTMPRWGSRSAASAA